MTVDLVVSLSAELSSMREGTMRSSRLVGGEMLDLGPGHICL